MTTEERFQRIEHVTAGLAEQAQRDREENRHLWRETQRQLDQLAANVGQLGSNVGQLGSNVGQLATNAAQPRNPPAAL